MDDRLTAVEESAARHELWHQDIGTRMLSFEEKLDANCKDTKAIKDGTGELIELLNSWKGAMRVFEIIGKVAKPLGAIAALAAAITGLWPKGVWPK